jgi:hypothetical protein
MRERVKWVLVTAIGAVCGAAAGTAASAPAVTRQEQTRQPVVREKGLAEGTLPGLEFKRSRKGVLKVRNLTYGDYIDVWLTLDDPDTDWYYMGTVSPRRWRAWRLVKGPIPYIAAADSDGDTSFWEWTPARFWMGRRFTWSLYN